MKFKFQSYIAQWMRIEIKFDGNISTKLLILSLVKEYEFSWIVSEF